MKRSLWVSSSGDLAASLGGSISADGRYVAFSSDDNTLDPWERGGRQQLFLHDRLTQTTILIAVSAAGEQSNNGVYGPSISADGKLVAFESDASNLVSGDTNDRRDVFVFKRP